MKEWTLSIKDIAKKLVKQLFQSPIISCFNPISEWWQQNHFQNGDNKTIFKNLEKELMSVITLKPNLCTTYIELDKHFGRKERER